MSRPVFIALFLMLWQQVSIAQCLSSAERMSAITAIENITDKPKESSKEQLYFKNKIEQLIHLQQLSLQCLAEQDSIYARILHRLGDYHIKIGDYEKAIIFNRQAIAINSARKPGSLRPYLVNSYFNLGLCYYQLNIYQQANAIFDSCISLSLDYPEKGWVALMAYERKSYLYFKTGDYQKSIASAGKGVMLAEKLHNLQSEALLLSQKAQSQIAMDKVQEAEVNIKKAIQLLLTSNDSTKLAPSYSIYASLLRKLKDGKNAVAYYNKAFQINYQQNNWLQCCRDMMDLGMAYKELNDPVNAFNCYKKGEFFIRKTKDAYELAVLYNNIGFIYWTQKNYKRALSFYQRALNTLPIHFSDTALKSNPSDDVLKQGTNDYYISTFLSNKGEALLNQYQKDNNQAFLTQALKAFEVADKSVDHMRCNQYNEPSKLFWREKTKKMYENAIEVCYLLNDINKAFYFFEKSRAVLLNDKLGELGAKKFLPEAQLAEEQNMQYNISLLDRKLSAAKLNSPGYNETQRQLLNAQEEREQFIKNLEVHYPAYYNYKYQDKVFPIDSVYSEMKRNNQSLVEYFTGDSTLYILSVSANNSKLMKLPLKEYSDKANELMTLCADASMNQNYPRYSALAYDLYKLLFQPLQIRKGRVIVSPGDEFIPFEALLSNQHNNSSFLVKDYAFSYTYSASFLLRSNVSHQSAENNFLGVAPVNYQVNLGVNPLKGGDESLMEIKDYYNTSISLVNEDATRQQFLASLPSSRIVQLYSHVDADSTAREPVIYLADSIIYLSEIQELKNVKTEMIILSACNTGVGKNARGEGILSLARAFTAAGIPSTLTTLWKVDSRTTFELTKLFHIYLSQGFTKDRALQKAKLHFLQNNDKNYQLPYFWAANIILGKTNGFILEKPVYRVPYYLVAVIFSLLVIVAGSVLYKSSKDHSV